MVVLYSLFIYVCLAFSMFEIFINFHFETIERETLSTIYHQRSAPSQKFLLPPFKSNSGHQRPCASQERESVCACVRDCFSTGTTSLKAKTKTNNNVKAKKQSLYSRCL